MVPFDRSSQTKSIHLVIPEVVFSEEGTLSVCGSELEIHPRSRQARVLNFFWNNPGGLLKREDLIEILYQTDLEERAVTIQFEGSLWKCSHQVMSRLRRTMCYCFSSHMPPGTEWLPYSSEREGWILYKLPGYGSDGGWHA